MPRPREASRGRFSKDERDQGEVANQAKKKKGNKGNGLGFLLKKGGEEDA